jgi:superoxide dismutase, Fe-Mn family
MTYSLPVLPYGYGDLEPYIDAKTMEVHYTKHHQTYVDKLNSVIGKYPNLSNEKLPNLLMKLSSLEMDEKDKNIFRNNAGGHLNHTQFWNILNPKNIVDTKLVNRIKTSFGSLDEFKKLFTDTALNHFGSGWGWLVEDKQSKLSIYSTPNQDSPYLNGHTPLIGIDVWEHAYYLKYQNRRMEYIENWWKVVKMI